MAHAEDLRALEKEKTNVLLETAALRHAAALATSQLAAANQRADAERERGERVMREERERGERVVREEREMESGEGEGAGEVGEVVGEDGGGGGGGGGARTFRGRSRGRRGALCGQGRRIPIYLIDGGHSSWLKVLLILKYI